MSDSIFSQDIHNRAAEILATMDLEQKVGQMTQAERMACTPEDVREFHLGSVLSGGGSCPGENRPQDSDTLRLREPGEQDADGDEALVEREEVQPTLDDDDCGKSLHGKRADAAQKVSGSRTEAVSKGQQSHKCILSRALRTFGN